MAANLVDLEEVSFRRGRRSILRNISCAVAAGEFVAIVGPNGAGKSTLLSLMAGGLVANEGRINFAGKPISSWPKRALAQRRAVLVQSTQLAFHYTVDETLRLSAPDRASRPDLDVHCARSVEMVGLAGFGHRLVNELSGGEQQRVHLARILVQLWSTGGSLPQLLFLDEPIAGLDLKHQVRIMGLARQLIGEKLSVVAVVHDMNLALHFASRVICMSEGTVVCDGPPQDCLTPQLLGQVFGVSMSLSRDAQGRSFLNPLLLSG